MPDVKQQFQIAGVAVLMTKTQHLNAHRAALAIRAEALEEVTPKRMDRVFRRVDNLIGKRANARHRGAFRANRLQQSLRLGRMRTTRLTKAMLQHLVRRFEEQNVDSQTSGTQSIIELHGGNRLTAIGFPGDPVVCLCDGTVVNNAIAYTYARIEQVGIGALSQLGQHHATVANAYGTLVLECDTVIPASGVITTTLAGYVNAGVGSWLPTCSMLVWG